MADSLFFLSKYALRCCSFADNLTPLVCVGCCCLPAGDLLRLVIPISALSLYVLAGAVLPPPIALVLLFSAVCY